MPRFEHKCACDKCGCEPKPNDENDVSFNGLKLVYCESCYQNLIAWWECWDSNGWKVVPDQTKKHFEVE